MARLQPTTIKNQKCNVRNRTIFLHDNLEILQGINDCCIDLIYLDSPFNKNKKFIAPTGSSADGAEFSDIFREEDVKDDWLKTIREDQVELHQYLNGIKGVGKRYNFAYLAYMAIRLIECHRILKSTGSLYLHCDPTMSHYLKTALDSIFGEENFRNEIIWQRMSAHNDARRWGSIHDSLLFYSKSKSFTWTKYRTPLSEDQISKRYRNSDENGLYTTSPLQARSLSGGGYVYEWGGRVDTWKFPKARLDELNNSGLIHWPKKKDGVPRRKVYLTSDSGRPVQDVISDISALRSSTSERVGYPTQKPIALLARIINSSSNRGDMVLDPFCGCATTCIAAENNNRQWIGIDVSQKAYDLVKLRLDKEVVRTHELPQFQEEVHLTASPPRRSGVRAGLRETKHVYVISNPKYRGKFKVGIAKNVLARLNAYQTGDPERRYKLEFSHETHLFRETEAYIHEHFENEMEWVTAELKDIKREILNYTDNNG